MTEDDEDCNTNQEFGGSADWMKRNSAGTILETFDCA